MREHEAKITLNAVKEHAQSHASLLSLLSAPPFAWPTNLYGDESLPRLADRFRFGLSTNS
jgi:hypothetical protein